MCLVLGFLFVWPACESRGSVGPHTVQYWQEVRVRSICERGDRDVGGARARTGKRNVLCDVSLHVFDEPRDDSGVEFSNHARDQRHFLERFRQAPESDASVREIRLILFYKSESCSKIARDAHVESSTFQTVRTRGYQMSFGNISGVNRMSHCSKDPPTHFGDVSCVRIARQPMIARLPASRCT